MSSPQAETRGVPIALTIAGSDSSGGAGLQADLKTFSALGVYGASVVTAITAQNTRTVSKILPIPADIVSAQLEAVFTDLSVNAIKIGMLGTGEIIEAVAVELEKHSGIPVVLDPVMVSTTGSTLLSDTAVEVLIRKLFPLAAIITPNIPEAADLTRTPQGQTLEDMQGQVSRLKDLGAKAVLLKGGHLSGKEAVDVFDDGTEVREIAHPRVPTKNTHGSGCTLASAITAKLALGRSLSQAVGEAVDYTAAAIAHADELNVGKGSGPLHHFYNFWKG